MLWSKVDTYWSYRISKVLFFVLILKDFSLANSQGIPDVGFVPQGGMYNAFDWISSNVCSGKCQKSCQIKGNKLLGHWPTLFNTFDPCTTTDKSSIYYLVYFLLFFLYSGPDSEHSKSCRLFSFCYGNEWLDKTCFWRAKYLNLLLPDQRVLYWHSAMHIV